MFLFKKAMPLFRDIVKKAIAKTHAIFIPSPQQISRTLRPRDQKAVFTKAVFRFLKTQTAPLKIEGKLAPERMSTPPFKCEIILTPGSVFAVVTVTKHGIDYYDRVSIQRLSDFIVTHNGFEDFYTKIRHELSEKA
jgi:hypothetical protein